MRVKPERRGDDVVVDALLPDTQRGRDAATMSRDVTMTRPVGRVPAWWRTRRRATRDLAVTSTKETWLNARLNSLTKSTNSGYLFLIDGTRAFYRYVGDAPQELHAIFGTYDGPVHIRCAASMDENLKVVSLDIVAIERVQGNLLDLPELGPDSDGD